MTWVATAIVGSAVVGGVVASSSASKAAKAQTKSAQAGIAEERYQFEEVRKLLAPYVAAGEPALAQQQAMLGLSGPEAERQALAGIESSASFQSQMQQGENALLQRASATGGLRGGNIQAALAQFRPQLLAQEIENRYGRLAGMTTLGQQSAAGVGSAGMQTGSNIANLMGQQGAAQAGGALAQGQAWGNVASSIPQAFGMYQGMNPSQPQLTSYGTIPGSQQSMMLASQGF